MPPLVVKFFRYIITGGLAAGVDAGGFQLLVTFGASTATAAITSWLAAALVNYQLTSHFVFERRATRHRMLTFLLVAVVGLSINVSVTLAGVKYLVLQPLVAKILGIGIAFVINFALNVAVVFS